MEVRPHPQDIHLVLKRWATKVGLRGQDCRQLIGANRALLLTTAYVVDELLTPLKAKDEFK